MPSEDRGRSRGTIGNALMLAMDSIRAHKLRSFLTLLGVIIGVASVIFVGSAIEGMSVYAEESTAKAFGSNTFIVAQVAGVTSMKQFLDHMKTNKPFHMEELKYLKDSEGSTDWLSAFRNKNVDMKRESYVSENANINGVDAEYGTLHDVVLTDGRFFTPQEEQSRIPVTVIGDDVRQNLFPDGSSPINRIVKMAGIEFTVTGVEQRLGSAFGQSQDNEAYIPITVYNRIWGQPGPADLAIFVRPRPGTNDTMQDAIDQTRVNLRVHFHQMPGQPDHFDFVTPDAIKGFIDSILGFITAIVVPVTCISLVVGGVVIMNIMLVSVTERTREIGIRKSLGARRSDIMLQVLIEATIMAMAGGAMGVALGALVTAIAGAVFHLSLHITLPYVLLSVVVSSLVGIVSGWYPAQRAAKLDPIVALRSE